MKTKAPTKKLICPCEDCTPVRVHTCPCRDCGKDTRRTDFYMVHHWLWDKHVPEDTGEGEVYLCVLCLEKRMGRKLTRQDFGNFYTNAWTVQRRHAGPELRDRMGFVAHVPRSRKGAPVV